MLVEKWGKEGEWESGRVGEISSVNRSNGLSVFRKSKGEAMIESPIREIQILFTNNMYQGVENVNCRFSST